MVGIKHFCLGTDHLDFSLSYSFTFKFYEHLLSRYISFIWIFLASNERVWNNSQRSCRANNTQV